jgi:hypothetical protein
VVGRTNRRALLAGAAATPAGAVAGGDVAGGDVAGGGAAGGDAAARRVSVTTVGTRPEAVAWVRATLGPGDAVLYENDLPDHYP